MKHAVAACMTEEECQSVQLFASTSGSIAQLGAIIYPRRTPGNITFGKGGDVENKIGRFLAVNGLKRFAVGSELALVIIFDDERAPLS